MQGREISVHLADVKEFACLELDVHLEDETPVCGKSEPESAILTDSSIHMLNQCSLVEDFTWYCISILASNLASNYLINPALF